MARKRPTPFPYWATRKKDGFEKRFIRLGDTFLLDQAVQALTPRAYQIYTYMLLESGGKQVFTFPHAKFEGFCPNKAFIMGKKELIQKGFIEEIENNSTTRKPNVYRFSDAWKPQSI